MGSCSSCNSSEYSSSHVNSEDKNDSNMIQRKKSTQIKGTGTYGNSKTSQIDEENMIADECSIDNESLVPVFVKQKYITEGIVKQRTNRFMADLEEEVRYRIKQIQHEEEQEKAQLSFLNESFQQMSVQDQKLDTSDFNNSAHFNQSISFQNSQDFQHTQNLPSKTYLPRQYSQFAPKKDTDTYTQNSQVSMTANSFKVKGTPTREKNRMVQTVKEEVRSNMGSQGSRTNNGHTADSQEVQFSDHFREQLSSSASKERSVRSILKTSYHQTVLRDNSIKSTYTNVKQKKVSFSNDTNYYTSRTNKRNSTNLKK